MNGSIKNKYGYKKLFSEGDFGMQPTNYEFLDKIADVFYLKEHVAITMN